MGTGWYVGMQQSRRWSSTVYSAVGFVEDWLNRKWQTSPIVEFLRQFCGVDIFGPFIIKQRRSQVKRYRAMSPCMTCWAVHIEITHSLDTDSFILALRRLIARRESVQTIFSDNGSNFIGSENELRRALEEMDKNKLQSFMLASGGD